MVGESAQLLTNLKHSSIRIGDVGSKLATETEQGKQFIDPNNAETKEMNDMGKNKEMKNYLKGHHFELGSKKAMSINVNSPHSVMTGSNHYLNS